MILNLVLPHISFSHKTVVSDVFFGTISEKLYADTITMKTSIGRTTKKIKKFFSRMFKRGYNYIALTLIETSNDGGGFTIRNVSNSQTLLVTANKSLLSSMIS